MITVACFSKPEEAHLLRMRLEAGGVPAYVLDENTIQMDWLYSNAIGGVRVQIDEQDLEAALEIVRQPAEPDVGGVLPSESTPCPQCSSTNTLPDDLPQRLSYLSLLVLGFPFILAKNRWKCADCGHTWRETLSHEATAHMADRA